MQKAKDLLDKILTLLKNNLNIFTEEELSSLEIFLNKILYKDSILSKYQVYTHLNISRASLDRLIKNGKFPKGKHHIGFKELYWLKSDVENYIKGSK